MGVDLKCTCAGCIQALTPEGLGQFDPTETTAISLLGVFTLAHDDFDKGLNIWPDACGLLADAFWRPICTETVMRGHVIAVGGVLAITRGFGVGGDALSLKIYLYGACGDPRPQLLIQQLVWHRVIMPANIDVLIKTRAALLPLGINVRGNR